MRALRSLSSSKSERLEAGDQRVEHVAQTVAVLRRDGEHVLESETEGLARIGFEPPRVSLVRRDQHAFTRPTQQPRQLFIERRHPPAHIYHPEKRLSLVDGGSRLLQNVGGSQHQGKMPPVSDNENARSQAATP